jgi:hypothetical protein
LKSLDENLKSKPKQFWKYVATFRKIKCNFIRLEVDVKHLIKHYDVADEFSKHFQSVYNIPCPIAFPKLLSSSEFLPLVSVVDNIPGFTIKSCMDIFVPIRKHIFNLSLSQQYGDGIAQSV